jgi:hypothetical protein
MKRDEVELVDMLIHANIKRLLQAQIVAHCDLPGDQIMAMMIPIEHEIELLKEKLIKLS